MYVVACREEFLNISAAAKCTLDAFPNGSRHRLSLSTEFASQTKRKERKYAYIACEFCEK